MLDEVEGGDGGSDGEDDGADGKDGGADGGGHEADGRLGSWSGPKFLTRRANPGHHNV